MEGIDPTFSTVRSPSAQAEVERIRLEADRRNGTTRLVGSAVTAEEAVMRPVNEAEDESTVSERIAVSVTPHRTRYVTAGAGIASCTYE